MARSGELYPCETDERLCEQLETGAEVEVDLEADRLTDLATGRTFSLKPLGEVWLYCPRLSACTARLCIVNRFTSVSFKIFRRFELLADCVFCHKDWNCELTDKPCVRLLS